MAQEQEEHQHREAGADHHGVAHRVDRVPHQGRLIVHPLQRDPRRETVREGGHDPRHAVRDGERVPLDLTGDIDERGGLAVTGDDADVIFRPQPHGGHVAHPHALGEHDAADVLRAARFLVGDDQVLPVVLRDAAHRLHRDRPPDGVGHVGVRQPQGGEPRRVRHDFDLAHVRPLNVHTAHAGHARDQRLDLVARDVVEGGGVAPLEVVRKDRKQGRREPLDFDLEIGGQPRLNLAHARAHELQCVGHVGARGERDGDFARPTDGVRLHARHAGHHAHRLLEGPRDAEHHLPRAERGALGHDLDPRELKLGVDGRREEKGRPDAGDGEEHHGEVDEAALAAQNIEQRHGAVRTIFVPSSMP